MSDELDALLEKATPIKITVDKPNVWHKIGLLPKERIIELRPFPYGVFLQIADCFAGATEIKSETFKDMCQSIKDNEKQVTNAVAYAINRTEDKPSKALINFIRKNIATEDLVTIVYFILTQMQFGNFTNAINLLTRRMIADSEAEQNSSET